MSASPCPRSVESGQTESQIGSSLGSFLGRNLNPYQIKFALRDSRGLSLSFLKQAISYLIETDYQIKTGLYEKSFLFEKALLQIASQVNWNYFWNYNPRQYYLVVGFLLICLFYTQWKSKSKLAAGCSKHCFEVVDRTDEVSNHIYGKATLTRFEEIFEEYD